MVEDQPAPVATGRRAAWDIVIEYMTTKPRDDAYGKVHDEVIADMRERDRLGRERYGTPLTAFNGRKHLVDAYQELLDFVVYLAAWLDERYLKPTDSPLVIPGVRMAWSRYNILVMFTEHVRTLVRLRALINRTAEDERRISDMGPRRRRDRRRR